MKLLFIIIFTFSPSLYAKLNVVTTTTTLKAITQFIGGGNVNVVSLTKSSQDPHFVEAKPSYIVKLRKADLLIAVGLGLEVGWLGLLQRGAKSPKLLDPKLGFLEAGSAITPIEQLSGKVDKSQGDLHPEGNPHFHLDPIRTLKFVKVLTKRLGELDAKNKNIYLNQAQQFELKVRELMPVWKKRVLNSGIKSVITYHRSFNYFLNKFSIKPLEYIEPKPGVPPKAKHIIKLIKLAKSKKIKCILNESYFETTAAKRIQKESGAYLHILSVEAEKGYFQLMESMVSSIEACGKGVAS